METTKADIIEKIVLDFADNNPNSRTAHMRAKLKKDINDALYTVSATKYPVVDVVDTCMKKYHCSPPVLKPCPFCGAEAKYGCSQARFLRPELVNLYVIAGCKSCGISTPLFKIGDNLLDACRNAAAKWNVRHM